MAIGATVAAVLLPAVAEAAQGFSTANVNMRSGPSTRYPAVTVIPVGTSLEIHGCLADTPWCDVSFYNGRGWVAGRYVQAQYQQRRVYVEPDYYGSLGIPLVTFELGNYWDRNYRNRDFYRERDYYRRDRDRDRDRYNQNRPRRDYNTYERPRYNNNDGIVIERPGRDRDRDRERIERRRDDNARQFDNDQNNRRDRDRERIERRNDSTGQQFDRTRNRERSNDGQFDRRDNNRQDAGRNNDRVRDIRPRCLADGSNCN
ncbi:SH3 domain-containing protein [Pararhizobium sp.]